MKRRKNADSVGKKGRLAKGLQNRDTRENIQYYLMMIFPLIMIFLFSYLPMFGIIIAFQDYVAGRPFFGEGVIWVGLKWFREFVDSYYFARILRNTLVLNALNLVMGFWVPIIFALIVNEIRIRKFKKFTQTVSYLPHFLSSVVVAGMVVSFIANDGIITLMLRAVGFEAKSLNADPGAFPWIYTLTSIWKSFGWGTIIYMAALTGVDPNLYEAAAIDGAGRWKQTLHVTFPGILSTVVLKMTLSLGDVLNAGFDQVYNLMSPVTMQSGDILDTLIYRLGMENANFGLSTAVGLFKSLVGAVFIIVSYKLAHRFTGYKIF